MTTKSNCSRGHSIKDSGIECMEKINQILKTMETNIQKKAEILALKKLQKRVYDNEQKKMEDGKQR